MNSIQDKRRIRLAMRIVENVESAIRELGPTKATVGNVTRVSREDGLQVATIMYALKRGKT